MKKILLLLSMAGMHSLFAQDLSYSVPGNLHYTEPAAPRLPAEDWKKLKEPVQVSFASSNTRYAKDAVPALIIQPQWVTAAWKGEKIHTQLLVWTNQAQADLSCTGGQLVNSSGQTIAAGNVQAGFVRYVMTDEFKDGCGYRKPADFDSSLVEDAIDIVKNIAVEANTVQPIWLSIQVPEQTAAGEYKGYVTVKADKPYQLQYTIKVIDRVLPPASQWNFDLDLWQHPAAIARVHGVPLWSDRHFELMKPYYTLLAGAGQKCITATILEEPWGHQTYDDFPGLVKWTKRKDGSWNYDYSLFDKYISFVMDCGIRKRINCYTMVPWALSFKYFDEASGKDTALQLSIGSAAYTTHLTGMLKDFTQHLKSKGWFDISTIAMDEREMKDMLIVIALLKKIDPEWKIALAGTYHKEIEKDIFDYCLASNLEFDKKVLKERLAQGKPSTYYTCCSEKYPNGFTFSPPAEHVWIGWYAAAKGFTGYLRWAYNSWVADPLLDSRFKTWPAGDTYQVYPGPRTSIRFEKMIEGIQDFEKIRLLREELRKNGQTKSLTKLNSALQSFDIKALEHTPAEQMIETAKAILNAY